VREVGGGANGQQDDEAERCAPDDRETGHAAPQRARRLRIYAALRGLESASLLAVPRPPLYRNRNRPSLLMIVQHAGPAFTHAILTEPFGQWY
jgi:hypothetical protein